MANPQIRLEKMIAKLREQGRRVTPERLAVLKILAKSEANIPPGQSMSRS
jgi:Fe2+ or Zn2+ uptake regulation protein